MSGWFDSDKAGLAAILERRGKAFALFELLGNAWDAGGDRVAVLLEPIPGAPYATLSVEDWGEGFRDLKDSFTMFARSQRAGDAQKRGRFGLGEKLVLACCKSATIESTCGSVDFNADGTRTMRKAAREVGSVFRGDIRMTREEFADVCREMRRLIPPCHTTFNGTLLDRPKPIATVETRLPTEFADEDGMLHRTTAKTFVEVYEAEDGAGDILEMGVPVVTIASPYRANVMQKVPLSMERDNVTPSYLAAINALLLNVVHERLAPEEAAKPWAQQAAGDARATKQAVQAVIAKRFGDKAVIATPGDVQANAAAEAAGYTVIPGGALDGDAWANVRKHELLIPASKAFPTIKPEAMAKLAETVCPLCGK